MSLFSRLLLMQLLVIGLLALVVGGLFYTERNITIATLYAERWAPLLKQAQAGGRPPAEVPATGLRQHHGGLGPPPDSRPTWRFAPRFVALRRALAEQGLVVQEVRLTLQGPEPLVWLKLVRAGRPSWWGVPGQIVVPEWSLRSLLALGLVLLLVGSASWVFTRRLTRPLEALHRRMAAHPPGAGPERPGKAASPLATVPEVREIELAWTALLQRQQQHQAERALLLAGVSHDLRSPLGRIRMAAELLPELPGVAPRRDSIVRNLAQADRLIESFLDHVRAGELPCNERVDLAAVARAVVAAADRAPALLSLDAPAQLWRDAANRLLLERLLANLVDNAFQHGAPPVQLQLRDTAAGCEVVVEDQGPGLAPEQAERLQQAFARGDPSRAAAGSGLGLAIVRQVVERLGGRCGFEPAGGPLAQPGLRVRVWLPPQAG